MDPNENRFIGDGAEETAFIGGTQDVPGHKPKIDPELARELGLKESGDENKK